MRGEELTPNVGCCSEAVGPKCLSATREARATDQHILEQERTFDRRNGLDAIALIVS